MTPKTSPPLTAKRSPQMTQMTQITQMKQRTQITQRTRRTQRKSMQGGKQSAEATRERPTKRTKRPGKRERRDIGEVRGRPINISCGGWSSAASGSKGGFVRRRIATEILVPPALASHPRGTRRCLHAEPERVGSRSLDFGNGVAAISQGGIRRPDSRDAGPPRALEVMPCCGVCVASDRHRHPWMSASIIDFLATSDDLHLPSTCTYLHLRPVRHLRIKLPVLSGRNVLARQQATSRATCVPQHGRLPSVPLAPQQPADSDTGICHTHPLARRHSLRIVR